MTTLTAIDIRNALRAACKLAGSQSAWADRNKLSAAYVTDVLKGRRDPGQSILKALGYKRSTVYVKKER